MTKLKTKAKRLVLFDIDGTILLGGPLWKECYIEAFSKALPNIEFPKINFAGKTDIQITFEILKSIGLSNEEAFNLFNQIINSYLNQVKSKVEIRKHEIKILPGIIELIEKLYEHDEVILSLLTGNVKEGAKLKLKSVSLDHYFDFDVASFGDDDLNRGKLPLISKQRAFEKYKKHFNAKEIVIIGDTHLDVECGRSINARTIAVGTGEGIHQETLLASNPDFFFKDLSQTFDVIASILEDL
jgi:phosphoglycolate phosphatase-like HAD superfamily hydrolase